MGDSSNLWGFGSMVPLPQRQPKWWEQIPAAVAGGVNAAAQARRAALEHAQQQFDNQFRTDQLDAQKQQAAAQLAFAQTREQTRADEMNRWHTLQADIRQDGLNEKTREYNELAAAKEGMRKKAPLTEATNRVKPLASAGVMQGILADYSNMERQAEATGSVEVPVDRFPLGARAAALREATGAPNPNLARAFAMASEAAPGTTRTMSAGDAATFAAPDLAHAAELASNEIQGDKERLVAMRPSSGAEDAERKALRANLFSIRGQMLKLAGGNAKVVEVILGGAMPDAAGILDKAAQAEMTGLAEAFKRGRQLYTTKFGGTDLWGTDLSPQPFQLNPNGAQGGPLPQVTVKLRGGEYDPVNKVWITQPTE